MALQLSPHRSSRPLHTVNLLTEHEVVICAGLTTDAGSPLKLLGSVPANCEETQLYTIYHEWRHVCIHSY